MRILARHGADEPFRSPAQIQVFEAEMRKACAHWQFDMYSETQLHQS